MATSSHCPRCRPSPPVGLTVAAVHYQAGHRQTQCPGCGLWRWPWEYPAPETVATGLRWRWSGFEWHLWRGHAVVGHVFPSAVHRGSWSCVRPTWASYHLDGSALVLGEAALVLVEAVR